MVLSPPPHGRNAKKERLLRLLLVADGDGGVFDGAPTRSALADAADVSASWCSEYLGRLERRGLVEGAEIRDVAGTYAEWEAIRPPRSSAPVSIQHLDEYLHETELAYALTTEAAENRYQGHLFPSRTELYVRPDEIPDWLDVVRERGMAGGGDARLLAADAGVFHGTRRIDGLVVVAVPQLVVDLRERGGPAREAADRLAADYHGGI
jgi:hypothetical protein